MEEQEVTGHNVDGDHDECEIAQMDDFASVDFSMTEFNFRDSQPTDSSSAMSAGTGIDSKDGSELSSMLTSDFNVNAKASSISASNDGISGAEKDALLNGDSAGVSTSSSSHAKDFSSSSSNTKDNSESYAEIGSEIRGEMMMKRGHEQSPAHLGTIATGGHDNLNRSPYDNTSSSVSQSADLTSVNTDSRGCEEWKDCQGDGMTCAECGKTFSHNFYFGTHIVCHMREKNYEPVGQCGMCGLVFKDNSVHNAHMMSVTKRLQQMEEESTKQQQEEERSKEVHGTYDPHDNDESFDQDLSQTESPTTDQHQDHPRNLPFQQPIQRQPQNRKRKKEKEKEKDDEGYETHPSPPPKSSLLSSPKSKQSQQLGDNNEYATKSLSTTLTKMESKSKNIPLSSSNVKNCEVVLEKLDEGDLLLKQNHPCKEDDAHTPTKSSVSPSHYKSKPAPSTTNIVRESTESTDCNATVKVEEEKEKKEEEVEHETPKKRARKPPVKFESVVEPKVKRARGGKRRSSMSSSSSSFSSPSMMRQWSTDDRPDQPSVDEDPEVEKYLQSLRDMGLTVDGGDGKDDGGYGGSYDGGDDNNGGGANDMLNFYKQLVHDRDRIIGSDSSRQFTDLFNGNNSRNKSSNYNHHNSNYYQHFPPQYHNGGYGYAVPHFRRRLSKEEEDEEVLKLIEGDMEIMPQSGKKTRGERLKQRHERLSESGTADGDEAKKQRSYQPPKEKTWKSKKGGGFGGGLVGKGRGSGNVESGLHGLGGLGSPSLNSKYIHDGSGGGDDDCIVTDVVTGSTSKTQSAVVHNVDYSEDDDVQTIGVEDSEHLSASKSLSSQSPSSLATPSSKTDDNSTVKLSTKTQLVSSESSAGQKHQATSESVKSAAADSEKKDVELDEKIENKNSGSDGVVVPILSTLKYCGDSGESGRKEEGGEKIKSECVGDGEKGEEGDDVGKEERGGDVDIQEGEDIEGWTVSITMSDSEEEGEEARERVMEEDKEGSENYTKCETGEENMPREEKAELKS